MFFEKWAVHSAIFESGNRSLLAWSKFEKKFLKKFSKSPEEIWISGSVLSMR